jgi:hypothetical protein
LEILMPPAKTPPEQLHEAYLKALLALHEKAEASQEHMRESSEALLEANRSSLELLAERLIEVTERSARELSEVMLAKTRERVEVVIQPATTEDALTKEERLKQRQLVLTYNAFRTMLGRAPTSGGPGAAAVFLADRVDEDGVPDCRGESITILSPAPFTFTEDGWTLMAITNHNQTLRAPIHRHELPVRVQVPHLGGDVDVARLQIHDHSGDPIYLGLGRATQTRNAERHKRTHDGNSSPPLQHNDDKGARDSHLQDDSADASAELDRGTR